MYIIIFCVIFILGLIALSFSRVGKKISDFLKFFAEGKDKGFLFSNLFLLWRAASYVGLEHKSRLFWSTAALDECITFITRQVDNPMNPVLSMKMQNLLTKLYDYRTKVELEEIQKKRGLETTHEIGLGQICIIFVAGETTVYAKITANKKDGLTFALFDASAQRAKKILWSGKSVRVYFWRQKDAGYIFTSEALHSKQTDDHIEITIKHSKKIVRTQKRKSVRALYECDATMFPLRVSEPYNSDYQTEGGIKCKLKDISEDGAMFFVKGKAAKGIRIKLQFKLKNTYIVMGGKIVRFLYDAPSNKSRIHFQCEFLDQKMKNIILSYIYNITTENTIINNDNEFMETILNDNSTEIDDEKTDIDENNVYEDNTLDNKNTEGDI